VARAKDALLEDLVSLVSVSTRIGQQRFAGSSVRLDHLFIRVTKQGGMSHVRQVEAIAELDDAPTTPGLSKDFRTGRAAEE